MVFDTNKERGNAGLSMAIAYFGANGYTVSLPLNDTQDYDLIVDKDNKLYKVQVKSTGHKDNRYNSKSYKLNLRSMGGTKGTVYKRVKDTDVDLIFALDAEKNMFLFPKSEIMNVNSCISISTDSKNRFSKYVVKI